MKNWIITTFLALGAQMAFAQAPAGYYDTADSLSGEELRIALRQIIRNHTVRSYNALWNGYEMTDKLPSGKVWDMYSHVPNGPQPYTFTFGSDQCGNYSGEGDCYNREHTWPQSKFGGGEPMRTDIVLVIPTDGTVNGKRSNWPYGEVSSATWTSRNGSKLGTNTYAGSPNTTAFEPIDEYKGDIARIMFYVVTRYYKIDAGWANWEMGNKAELNPWAKQMFLDWHRADPVSDKERERNDGIYDFQNNRNPYVDHPEYVDCVFDPVNCIWPTNIDTGNSIPFLLSNKEINMYPNPTTDVVTLKWLQLPTEKLINLSIVDMTGRVQQTMEVSPRRYEMEVSMEQLPKGLYMLKLANEDIFYVEKLIKN